MSEAYELTLHELEKTGMALAIAADQLSAAHKRIAELEAALQDIMDMRENLTWGHAREVARKALEDDND